MIQSDDFIAAAAANAGNGEDRKKRMAGETTGT
jgi:hypothetical protein